MTRRIDRAFSDREEMQRAAAKWMADHLQAAVRKYGSATYFGSGGSTPGPAYRALSEMDLSWADITIGLVDERWVPLEHDASNEKLLRTHLRRKKAAIAPLVPMVTDPSLDPFLAAPDVAANYAEITKRPDVVVLGMGSDAHALSWFAGARGLAVALDQAETSPVAAIEAIKSDVTGDNLLRMTLTWSALARSQSVILMLTGDEKRRVFEMASDEAPIAHVIRACGDKMTVFWSP
ncbi:MAG: 6-phosphogluconolactonase [Pseudomonadota bacterium]